MTRLLWEIAGLIVFVVRDFNILRGSNFTSKPKNVSTVFEGSDLCTNGRTQKFSFSSADNGSGARLAKSACAHSVVWFLKQNSGL